MKPKLSTIIYTVSGSYQINEEKVAYLGEESFIIENYPHYTHNYEFNYDDYNKVWFRSFTVAKKALGKIPKGSHLVECNDFYGRWWEVMYKDARFNKKKGDKKDDDE